jgi:hypothetical protein
MPFPTDEVANVPNAVPDSETESPLITPTRVPGAPTKVAVVDASYVLFEAVMPETVKFFAVMFAVVVGWVRV